MHKRLGLIFLVCSTAHATELHFGASYSHTVAPFWTVQLGFNDWEVAQGSVNGELSNRALQLGYRRSLTLPALGGVQAQSSVALAFGEVSGVRISSQAQAALGPIALNLAGSYFTAPLWTTEPLGQWAAEAKDLRPKGWNIDLEGRYRLSRERIVRFDGEWGNQANGFIGVEGRRDLLETSQMPATPENQPLPPSEDEWTDEELGDTPEPEKVATLTWTVGARAGQDVLGLALGASYALEATGITLAVDGLFGPKTLGVGASAFVPEALGEGSGMRLYAAYEPWRWNVATTRLGAELAWSLGGGQLLWDIRGGTGGFGTNVQYSWRLGE